MYIYPDSAIPLVGWGVMSNHGECQNHITSDKAALGRAPNQNGFLRNAFRRLAPLVAGGAIMLGSATAGAFELSGFGRIDSNQAEKGSEYASSWSREAGLKLNTDPKRPYYGEAKISYFSSRKEAKLSSPNRIVTEQMVLQQSLSVMRAGDTLSLAPMSFRMTGIAQSGNDYTAHFDITDTGTGEPSSLDIRIGDKARFPWKDKLYVIETEGDNLLASPQTVYVRAFRAQENSEDEHVSIYPSILDEGIEGSLSFGAGKGRIYGLIGVHARALRRDAGLRLEAGQASVTALADSRRIVIPGAIATAAFGRIKGSFKGDREKQSGSLEVRLRGFNVLLEAAQETIRTDTISWRNKSATGVLDIKVLSDQNGFIDIVLGGGVERNRISAEGTYVDPLNSATISRDADLVWRPMIVGVRLSKGPVKMGINGAVAGKNRRGACDLVFTFR